MGKQRAYNKEYKVQAAKLAHEIGSTKAANELGIPTNTLYGWMRAQRLGRLDLGAGTQTPQTAMSLADEVNILRQQVKNLTRENRRLKEENEFLEEASAFFRREPSEVSKSSRMKFIAQKTEDGEIKGKLAMYCSVLNVSRQGFYNYLKNRNKPWKYQALADAMMGILAEDECNDTYGRERMHQALLNKKLEGVHIPSERTVYRVMEKLGISHTPKRKPHGITKADKESQKSDDLIKRDFTAEAPLEKCITDITEIKAADGKLYVSAIFDCFDVAVVGLAMADNMRADLCVETLVNAYRTYPDLRGCIIHSDRGSQYTSEIYRNAISKYGIIQSMNSAGGRCHDNARCESMWARMKEELLYGRYNTEKLTIEELKTIIWRYFMSYWNNRRICTANGGLPPMEKRRRYELSVKRVA